MVSFIFGMDVSEDTSSADLAQWGPAKATRSITKSATSGKAVNSEDVDEWKSIQIQLEETSLNPSEEESFEEKEEFEVNQLLWAPRCEKKTRSRIRPNTETQDHEDIEEEYNQKEECIEKEKENKEEKDIEEFDDGDDSKSDSSDPIPIFSELSLTFFDEESEDEKEEEGDYSDDEKEDIKRTLVF